MNARPTPCSPQTIDRFLADELSGPDLAAFEDHLEACPSCRRRLERTAAEGSWWDEARGYLGCADPCRPDSSPGAASSGEVNSPLFGLEKYLGPTDDPRMLGRLGGYEVVGVVGRGGMGVVLKGWDAALHRYVAIKVLAPQLAAGAAARQRFAREAQAAAAVVHDNVLAIHAVAEANGLPYLVMPYVRGPSLEKRLQDTGAFGVVEVLRLGMQVAAGLAAAHAQGLIHRDIKPANLLLEDGVERVWITDFGLARAADDARLTCSGVIAGTPQYMSPEQARGDPIDPRSDLFSLGSVLYALCTGRPPFPAGTPLAVLRHVEEDRPRPIRESNPNIPDWLAAVVERLLAKDPAGRFQTAAEVAALLGAGLAHLQQPATVAAPPWPPPPGRGGGRVAPCLALAALVLLAAGGAATLLAFAGARADDDPGRKPFQEYSQSFRGTLADQERYEFYGPSECVHFEPDGLRLTLPAGPVTGYSAGLALPVTVKGDFEITVQFDILHEPERATAGKQQTRFTVDAVLDRPGNNVATLSRKVATREGTQFLAWMRLWHEELGKNQDRAKGFPTQAKSGRLRLVRTGSDLSYQVAEGAEPLFTALQQYPFGAENLKCVRLVGALGDPPASLDVRVTDLHIAAESLPDLAAAPPVPPARPRHWLAAVGIVGVLLAVLLGVGLYCRRRVVTRPGQGRRTALLLLVSLGLSALGPGAPTRGTAEARPRRHVAVDFREGLPQSPSAHLYGPDVETMVKADAQGLRITVPADRPSGESVGVELPLRLRGDFDLGLGYELLATGPPPGKAGVGVMLRLEFDSLTPLATQVTRLRKPPVAEPGPRYGPVGAFGETFGATLLGPGRGGRESIVRVDQVRALEAKGRLRLVRTGSQLEYWVTDAGAEPFRIRSEEIGNADVRAVRLVCHTGGKPVALDVRLTDLTIDAAQLGDEAAPPPTPVEAPATSPNTSLKAVALLSLGIVLALVAAGAVGFLLRRQRRAGKAAAAGAPSDKKTSAATAAPVLSCACGGCGKALRVKRELAGKRVKCPRCGQVVPVPRADISPPLPPAPRSDL
jgi:hypothetical protein